jgi:membrane protease YdiL (CAAX protease family)
VGSEQRAVNGALRREAPLALLYFAVYMGYMFWRPESDILHWVSLVGLPLALLWWMRRGVSDRPFRDALGSVGLRRSTIFHGFGWVAGAAVLIAGIQLLTPQGDAIIASFRSGEALYLLPLAMLLMLLLAATTEEVFFRGVLQTRLHSWFRSHFWAIAVCSVLFGLYHLPYAYLNPNWPSAGNWGNAFRMAMSNGVLGGVVLGVIYARSRNLLAVMVTHAFINAFPAMSLLKGWFGG